MNAQKKAVKLACIGDSVTAGYLLDNPTTECYPSQLQLLIGSSYEIKNFGHTGATIFKNGSRPYWNTQEYTDAIAYNPDIAIVHLGLNDTGFKNWPNFNEDFEADYNSLLDILKKQNPNIKIYICLMSPIFNDRPYFKSGIRNWFWKVQSHIKNIARVNQVGLINLHEKLNNRPDLFPDAIHPTKEGAKIIAHTVYENVTKDFGGLQMDAVFSDNMVLQRDQPIVIYGKANGGDAVEVLFNTKKIVVKTDEYGKWKAVFPTMSKGGPYELKVQSKEKQLLFTNCMLGDVWFCSGQSNMAFPLKKSDKGAIEIKTGSNNPAIRLFNAKVLRETDEKAWDSISLAKTNKLEYFSGNWAVCDSITAKDFSAIGYYFGKNIAQNEKVTIGLIQVAVGGSPIESWIDRYTLEHDDKAVDLLMNWRKSDYIMPWVQERAAINLKKATNPKQRHPFEACYNYEAGIQNFSSFNIKGVLWYQGESNADYADMHEHLLPSMVQSWRSAWKTNFPFYYVQLSGIDRPSWPAFRASQNKLQKTIPNSGMAVSMDYGELTNVHPTHKKEVADRLALLALKYTYGRDLVANSPSPLEAAQKGESVFITFEFAKKLKTSDNKEVLGFELVNEKGYRIQANATILENKISLAIPQGEKIKKVLYAWKPFSIANLVNEAGLPCSTFKLELKD